MSTPLDPRLTIGRIFGTDWTIANVAKLLRFNAAQGFLRAGAQTGSMREVDQNYRRTTAARHLPSGVAVTFRRDAASNYHAELCFASLDSYLPWDDAVAEAWLAALFLDHRPNVREVSDEAAQPGGVRHFVLAA
jgi:hypothetical protein